MLACLRGLLGAREACASQCHMYATVYIYDNSYTAVLYFNLSEIGVLGAFYLDSLCMQHQFWGNLVLAQWHWR